VSQPRASQVLTRLADQRAVRSTEHGYVGQPDRLLDLYQSCARPRLVEPETYWYSTRPMAEQAGRIVDVAPVLAVPIAFSADFAPDLIVPWRHPTLTVLYAADHLQLRSAGLVPAEGRVDASIILRLTSDRTLISAVGGWPSAVDGLPITDPVQQWWDLLDLGGDDRRETADRLRRAIIDRTIPQTT
jgi:hypothetical protein